MRYLILPFLLFTLGAFAQPNWPEIKASATFNVPDDSYGSPYIQSINVGGWEDGLYITRDGRNLYSTYLPVDAFSWLNDLVLDPVCFDFNPYFRPPLLGIDTVTNIFGCPNYMHSDVVKASRTDITGPFDPWDASNLQTSFSFDGGAQGVLLNADTFDLFIYTVDGPETETVDLMFMRNVPIDPSPESAVPILTTPGHEDNPHLERLNDSTIILIFDRDRYMYYAHSYDNGDTWEEPVLITNVLNDQAPYDVQPHLWHDGTDWWVYFCADDEDGVRCIYKSRQLVENDWNSWGEKELVIAPNYIIDGGYGTIFGVGEPTLTEWGDLSFVVVYGNTTLEDTTDVYDCDPWILPKKDSPLSGIQQESFATKKPLIFPNPARAQVTIRLPHLVNEEWAYLTNAAGMRIQKIKLNQTETTIPVQNLPAGLYFIQFENGNYEPQRFMKK